MDVAIPLHPTRSERDHMNNRSVFTLLFSLLFAVSFFNSENTEAVNGSTETAGAKAIRDASVEFGPIGGCYLPSREELEQHGRDKGFASSKHFVKELDKMVEFFPDFGNDVPFWSSTDSPDSPGNAFGLEKGGSVNFNHRKDNLYRARCVCSSPVRPK